VSLKPAALGTSPSGHAVGVPYSPLYDDVFHAEAGAWAQARHVFLGGNGLPGRWQGRQRFVILETGFGLGNNFLATWSAWLRDALRCDQLVFISIEKHPLHSDDLARVHGLLEVADVPCADEPDRARLAQRLLEQWPTLTPGWHTVRFPLDAPDGFATQTKGHGQLEGISKAHAQQTGQHVTLMLGLGDVAELLPNLIAQVDAFYLDGFAPTKNPDMWDEGMLSRLNKLAAPGSTASTWSSVRSVRDALAQAGFQVERVPGFAGKRGMTRAIYAPRFVAPPLPGGLWPEPELMHRHALVLGAGLAGCSAALALCRQGWRVTLVDQHAKPAQEASGNPGGLFHSILHGEDGVHARAHRAAALATWRAAIRYADGGLLGQFQGLLRLDGKTSPQMARDLLDKLGLPDDHVQWLDEDMAREACGLAVASGGWLFKQAGWLHPAGLASAMLEEAASLKLGGAPLLQCLWGQAVDGLKQSPTDEWQLLCGGEVVAQAPSLVLCNAMGVLDLLGSLAPTHGLASMPLNAVRGQISRLMPDAAKAAGIAMQRPRLPVAGAGYVIGLHDGSLLCGATSQHHDADPAVRDADHQHNLQQAQRLGALPAQQGLAQPSSVLLGRTAWRATTPDRLPLVGALPWSLARLKADRAQAEGRRHRLDQARLIPRARGAKGGLFVLTGLGSRGITWSTLAGELLAHWVTGSPCPVEADLRDALDPARFVARLARASEA
jgi:tRNA 5-methylaminomethyl-2-thiouridine biosynthesis bifunctional protein